MQTPLVIRMMGEDNIVIFHYCPEKAGGYVTDQHSLPISGETTKILLRISFEKFADKKFKPLKCRCGLKMTPDEVVFNYFTDRIMGGE